MTPMRAAACRRGGAEGVLLARALTIEPSVTTQTIHQSIASICFYGASNLHDANGQLYGSVATKLLHDPFFRQRRFESRTDHSEMSRFQNMKSYCCDREAFAR